MIDYERIALDALAGIDMPPDTKKREFDNLCTVMQAEISDLRRSELPVEEIEAQMRTWADMHAKVLRVAHP